MRFALFTDTYSPNTDGVVSSIMALRSGLRMMGHDWSIFTPDSPGYIDDPSDRVHRFKAFKFPPYPDYRLAFNPYFPDSSSAKKEDIRLVHSKAMASMAIAAYRFASGARLPSVATLETMIPDGVHYISKDKNVQAIGRKVAWGYLRFLYSHFDKVTVPSEHTRKILLAEGVESVVMPSPIDTEIFKPNSKGVSAVRKKYGLKKEKLVLSVGRVVKEKNYDFILEVAKRFKPSEVRFVLAGRGPYLETLKQNVSKMGLSDRVSFSGFMPKEELIAHYNAADSFIFPSKFETQGLTLLEAFACGKPAVVMEDTPMSDVLSDGRNGYVFRDDVPDCQEKLSLCIEKSGRFAKAARKAALEYSIPACSKRLFLLYKSLL